MSHYTVMVIGDDPEEQLSNYDENLEVEEYEIEELSEEDKFQMIKYYKKEGHQFDSFEACYARFGDDWNGNCWRKNCRGIWIAYSTRNPNAKWDWYVLGGRWSGEIIRLKPGCTGLKGEPGVFDNVTGIDQARKGDIDFEAIRKEEYEKAVGRYREYAAKCGGSIPVLEIPWSDFHKGENDKLTIEEKRAKYNAQKAVQIWKKAGLNQPLGLQLEDLQCTEEEYGQRAADSSFSTFAYLIDGEWYERGRMGWFGAHTDDVSEEEWNSQIRSMLEALPADTLISIYDCHI